MDGTDWVYLKTNLRFRLFQKLYNLQRAMPLQQLKKLPFRLFARVHLESGYVHEPTYITTNILNNRAVIGYGVALDFLFWNTALMSVEYNRNDQGEGLIVLFSSFNF